MRKLLLALALLALPSGAWAQCTGVFPANTLCGNLSATAQPPRAFPSAGTIVGPGSSLLNGLPIWGNTSGTLLADGNGKSIPGNYTYLSGTTFNGPVSVTSAGTFAVSGTSNFSGAFNVGGATKTFPAGAVTLGGLSTTQIWTGVNTFTGQTNLSATTNNISGTAFFKGDVRIGNGPYFDVKSGAFGCNPAVGNGVADDTLAIQCAVNYISNTAQGGIVFFPKGTYKTTSSIDVGRSVVLLGQGVGSSIIDARPLDINMFRFRGDYGGLRDLFVVNGIYTSSTTSTVLVDPSIIQLTFRDCNIWGGKWALEIAAMDSYIENCFIMGGASAGGGLFSNGGQNWYIRDKFDTITNPTAYAALISGTGASLENGFVLSDFSGTYTTAAIAISATGAYTSFESVTVSNPVVLTAHTWTGFSQAKFGSFVSTTANKTTIIGSKAIGSITATNASCAANFGITC